MDNGVLTENRAIYATYEKFKLLFVDDSSA
jgi:hypothetical protein